MHSDAPSSARLPSSPSPPEIMFAQEETISLASLPTELHLSIAEHLAEQDVRALASLNLTSRYLSALCQPLLTSRQLLDAHLTPETYHSTLRIALTTKGARANTRETPFPVGFKTWHPNGCNNGRTLLHIAVECSSFTATELLLNHGANANAVTAPCCAEAPLHVAARGGDLALTRLLLSRGAKVDSPAGGLEVSPHCFWGPGATPLIIAVLNDRLDVAVELLRAGADVNFCGTPHRNGRRAPVVHYVKSVEMVKILFDAGAQLNKLDRTGKSVIYRRMIEERQSAGQAATQAGVLRELGARGAKCIPFVM